MRYLDQDELTQTMGIGYLGEVRQGPDGNLYQWVEAVDGLGNPVGGLWRRLRRIGRGIRRVVRRALPIAQRVTSAIPLPQAQAVAAGIRAVRRAGVAGHDAGLGALYQAPDGTVYQAQGPAQEEELQGLAENNEEQLPGLSEDEEEELQGLSEREEMEGLAEEEELEGLSEDEELQGLEQGYIRVQEPGMGDLDAYVPETPPQTRWFSPPATPPKLWEPLW